ncbi:hypothetical protein ACJMK2_006397 [Sinanodonta woodiana]|uniref:Uncharacterized protein n=1 Tax=Sinanodonta woodiana TaxID=1069815 RepID=A0ABD3VT23_SINWO
MFRRFISQKTPAPPPVQALPPNRPPVALPPQGNKYPRHSDVDDDDGWGSEEFDSGSESEEPFEIGGQVMKNEGKSFPPAYVP